uniref:Uncharacterized protein n=1 Tax=Romanomermis culicivorax TaxID=13658 RepID=A0A915KGC4_ROMCU
MPDVLSMLKGFLGGTGAVPLLTNVENGNTGISNWRDVKVTNSKIEKRLKGEVDQRSISSRQEAQVPIRSRHHVDERQHDNDLFVKE